MKKLIVFALIAAVIAVVSINFAKAEDCNIPDPNAPKDPNAPQVNSYVLLAEEPNIVEPNAMEPNAPAPAEPNV